MIASCQVLACEQAAEALALYDGEGSNRHLCVAAHLPTYLAGIHNPGSIPAAAGVAGTLLPPGLFTSLPLATAPAELPDPKPLPCAGYHGLG